MTTSPPTAIEIGLCLLLAAVTVPVVAAPIQRPANVTLSILIEDGYPVVAVANTGLISVDENAGTLSLPAGLINVPSTMILPVTSTTAVAQLKVLAISNQPAVFSGLGSRFKSHPRSVRGSRLWELRAMSVAGSAE